MSYYVRSAKCYTLIEDNKNIPYIDVQFVEFISGYGWSENQESLKAKVAGDWTQIFFSTNSCVRYEDFLNTMVQPSLKIKRKIASLTLNTILHVIKDTQNPKYHKKLLKCVNILDPTFKIPKINLNSEWQKEFIETFVSDWLRRVISGCKNWNRLSQFTYDLKVKEGEIHQLEEKQIE